MGNDNFIVVHQFGLRLSFRDGSCRRFCSQLLLAEHSYLIILCQQIRIYVTYIYTYGYSLGSPNKFNFDVFAWKTKFHCSNNNCCEGFMNIIPTFGIYYAGHNS